VTFLLVTLPLITRDSIIASTPKIRVIKNNLLSWPDFALASPERLVSSRVIFYPFPPFSPRWRVFFFVVGSEISRDILFSMPLSSIRSPILVSCLSVRERGPFLDLFPLSGLMSR